MMISDERWGDAPVHSIAVALFLPKDKIKFFVSRSHLHLRSSRRVAELEPHTRSLFCSVGRAG